MHFILKNRPGLLLVLALTAGVLGRAAPTQAADDFSCEAASLLPGTAPHHEANPARQAFCDVDFGSDNVAVCPKNWSTSAAALVYILEGTGWANDRQRFEAEVCPIGAHARDKASREAAVFKHSMNFRDTSGTYAPAILLYDHLSRWLDTAVQVPVAVEYRFDSAWYRERVVAPGLALAAEHPSRKMLLAAWQHLGDTVASTEAAGRQEFLLPDGEHVWGAALLFTGKRYGAEFNGTRESGWGKGQNYDFQHTAPFFALRAEGNLDAAVATGIERARADRAMADVLAATVDPAQVKWWMLELLDVIFLDYLLGQQDRIGNIDYTRDWLWLENGELRRAPATGAAPAASALKLRTSWLNDNDAGVRHGYANYARLTDMPKGLRHFNPALYQRLRTFAADMASNGPVRQAIAANYHLPAREVESIARRAAEIDALILAACRAGQYQFDLTPALILGKGEPATSVSCD